MTVKHLGTETLETERLILRRFRMEDADAMFRNWASDSEVTEFLMWPAHASPSVSRDVLLEWTARYPDELFYQWAIVPKDGRDEPIGSINVTNSIDADIRMAHIGYCIGKPWWHQGITSEALAAVIRFLFDSVGLNRIESRHDPHNANSGAVMKKCGMRYEGTLRQSDRNNRGVCDAAYYGLLSFER